MARTKASRASGGAAPQKKSSSGGGARGNGPKVIARAEGNGSGSPAKRGYGLQNHARRCATPGWQRSVSDILPGLALSPNFKPGVIHDDDGRKKKRKKTAEEDKEEIDASSSADDRDIEEPASSESKKKKKRKMATKSKESGEEGEQKKPKKKRARSAYICFVAERRAEVKQQNPDLKFGDVTKKLGELWKALTPEEKAKYEEMARLDKERVARGEEAPGEAETEKNAPHEEDKVVEGEDEAEKEAEEENEEEEQEDGEEVATKGPDTVVLDDMGDSEGEEEQEVSKARKKRRVVLDDEEIDDDL